jgi:D-3-phosphoglycerate dehydrogenase / 2-oxoglutarate reductase
MSKPVLVTTSSFSQDDATPRQALVSAGLTVFENPFKRKLTESEVSHLLDQHKPVGLLAGVEPLTAKVLEGAKDHLKAVSRCGVGLESVDLEAARRLGIEVLSTPDAPAPAVAELAIALMLSVLRRVSEADRALRAGSWKALQGRLLGDKTVGIVGLGRIGVRVAAICRAFGCRVVACDERRDIAAPEGVSWRDLDTLLAESDVITLHVPLLPATRGMLGQERLMRMKKGAVLINVSRGGLVSEPALVDALTSGHLGGAGLDVFEKEPYSGPLTKLDNVVLTAHMGSAAKECRVRMETEAAENLVAGLRRSGVL